MLDRLMPTIRTNSEMDMTPLRRFVRERVMPNCAEWDRTGEFPTETYRSLFDLGLFQGGIPERFGGGELKMSDWLEIARELAYGSAGIFTSTLASLLGMSPVALFGSEELRADVLPGCCQELSFWSYCMTEPSTGSDILNTRTRATRVEGGYVLDGEKTLITNASYAKHLSVYARVEGPEKRSLSCFYVPASTPGVQRGKALDKLGHRDSNTGTLHFENVFVPTRNLLGKVGDGLKINFRCLQRSKTLIGAGSVGLALRASDIVREYLAGRSLFGGPLLAQREIQGLLADLHTELQAAWLLACAAGEKWQSGDFAIREASMAKMFGSNMAVRFANEALELLGGYGFLREYPIEKLYRDAKVFEIYEGPTFIQRILIARDLFPEAWEDAKPNQAERKAA